MIQVGSALFVLTATLQTNLRCYLDETGPLTQMEVSIYQNYEHTNNTFYSYTSWTFFFISVFFFRFLNQEQGKKKKKKTKIALRMERDDISDVAGGGEFDDFEEL